MQKIKFVYPFRNTKTEITEVSGSNNVINAPEPVLETEPNLTEGISKAKLVRSYSFLLSFTYSTTYHTIISYYFINYVIVLSHNL